LTSDDHISSMIFYTAGSLPSGFATNDRIKKIFSLKEAENLGILDDHADETKGTGGQVTVTGTWIAGETVQIEIDGASLGRFVLTTTTITSLVAGLVAAINANTATGLKHGWVATDADPIVTLVQPGKLGVVNNAGSNLVFVDRNAADTAASAGGSSTDVQFSSGVGSYFAIEHYHISEYFRIQPKGVLFVGIFVQATYNGDEIRTVQDFALGEIRQGMVYLSHEAFAASQMTTSQADLDTLETEDKPMSLLFHADMAPTTAAALADLSTFSNERVSAIAGEDGDFAEAAYVQTKIYKKGDKITHQGKALIAKADIPLATPGDNPGPFDLTNWTVRQLDLPAIQGFSISTIGASLGTVSLASVHENIGYVTPFNLDDGTKLNNPGLATGELYRDISAALRDTLNDFHYIFIRDHQGISGTFHNDSHTGIVETNDFATIENVRTMDKAVRNIRISVLPNLNGPLFVDAVSGELSEDTISLFKSDAERPVEQMVTDGELSGQSVTIDPTQNVLSTSKLIIGVVLVPVGVAREIVFEIGFAVKIA